MKKINFKEPIVLENEIARLEPLGLNHVDELFPVFIKYPDLHKYSPKLVRTRDDLVNYINIASEAREKGQVYAFAIYDKRKNMYAGSTRYANISEYHSGLEIGWTWLSEDFQGTGLNKNCKFLLLRNAFENLQLERVGFRADSRNEKSIRAMEKIGAIYEGKMRSHMKMREGPRRDTVCFSILQSEWTELRKNVFLNYE